MRRFSKGEEANGSIFRCLGIYSRTRLWKVENSGAFDRLDIDQKKNSLIDLLKSLKTRWLCFYDGIDFLDGFRIIRNVFEPNLKRCESRKDVFGCGKMQVDETKVTVRKRRTKRGGRN